MKWFHTSFVFETLKAQMTETVLKFDYKKVPALTLNFKNQTRNCSSNLGTQFHAAVTFLHSISSEVSVSVGH